jgi:hypothetical protein
MRRISRLKSWAASGTINSGAKDGVPGGDDRLPDRLPAGGLKTMIWPADFRLK